MPAGTKVDRIFQALKRQGKSVSSAARIAQAVSGQALATGRPPRHKALLRTLGKARRGKKR